MTLANPERRTPTPPSIRDLTLRFLGGAGEAEGMAVGGEVVPHEVTVGLPTDPKQAWQDGLRALAAFGAPSASVSPPAEWAGFVSRQPAVAALPYAIGNNPQRVHDLNALLQTDDLSALRGPQSEAASAAGLRNWAAKQSTKGFVPAVVGASLLRAAGDFAGAASAFERLASEAPSECEAVFANEKAALLWQRGEWEAAAKAWNTMPESVPVLFNRGMAALFLNQPAEAAASLRKASAALPDTDAWHHLASLYLALAEMRNA